MRAHIVALETVKARLQAQMDDYENRHFLPASTQARGQVETLHVIEYAWRDVDGVFVKGWAHAGPHPVRQVALLCGGERVETNDFLPRPDLIPHHPTLPRSGAAGFSLYLPCPAHLPLSLAVTTDAGTNQTVARLPSLVETHESDGTRATDGFITAMHARAGTVLEIGARVLAGGPVGWRPQFESGCRYIGSDIHPGPNIDVVADVHALTETVAPASVDGIFSVAVLEHLAAPWLAAVEINRALKIGGETLHATHQTWPIHEMPNDFFRMSDQALRFLFGPATGFEVIECGMAYPVSILPPRNMRGPDWVEMPLFPGYAQSYIRARKTADLDPNGPPWSIEGLRRVSEAYPRLG
jgi:hypothetical protein